ncbi:glycosyltransferase [Loktanella sp. S4079]|uniref:glycosyltransferase n=1 Tax=Loktanella sp. S4079 TaxID=579483 RepID=UPI0005FA6A25|nr:glycosyltransferase [Loktanella sp. S4079]KJZ20667.1 glycosyl transferase family 1 [Loktanella sp. S4079]
MKVLHVSPSFYPATFWGGPIWSTKAICDGLVKDPAVQLRVLTTDAAGPLRADRVAPVPLDYPVTYLRRMAGHSIAPGLLIHLWRAVAWAEVVHLTGTYSFPTLPTLMAARIMGKPVVWSPRGALQASADWPDAPRQRVKRCFERVAQTLVNDRVVMHVTSQAEARASQSRIVTAHTAVIPNSVPIPAVTPKQPSKQFRLIYVGRIHPKKGLDLLIKAMAQLPAHVTLDIYGTGLPADVAPIAGACSDRIRMHGHLDDADKPAAFAKSDLFVLPSHSENFGIAVAEALAHAVPVLTTTATPWHALDDIGCGRCMDLGRDDLSEEIQALLGRDLTQMGQAGRAWMQRAFSAENMVAEFRSLYVRLIEQRAR